MAHCRGATGTESAYMKTVLVRWRVRGATMTDFGATWRAPGDEDTMDRQRAADLERCGFLKVLGASEEKVIKMADVVEADGEA